MDVCTSVRQLAELVGGKVVGDGDVIISDAAPLQVAAAGHVSFADDAKHLHALPSSKASALIARAKPAGATLPVIEVDDPLWAFVAVFKHFHRQPEPPQPGVDARASVHPTAKLGADVSLQAFVTVGENTRIGDRCRLYPGAVIGRHCLLGNDVTLYPNAVIYDGCHLGHGVIVHAGAIIGADGFGYRQQNGRHLKVPQLGHVEIGDDVEVGAGTTIDRGTFQPTRIGAGSKIDNLVQVGHNCQIGRHNILVALSALAGSCSTDDYVVIAGQAGIADHIHIGAGAMVGAQAGVIANVAAGQQVLGSPARPARETKLWFLNTERVAELRKDVQQIKQKLGLNGRHA